MARVFMTPRVMVKAPRKPNAVKYRGGIMKKPKYPIKKLKAVKRTFAQKNIPAKPAASEHKGAEKKALGLGLCCMFCNNRMVAEAAKAGDIN